MQHPFLDVHGIKNAQHISIIQAKYTMEKDRLKLLIK